MVNNVNLHVVLHEVVNTGQLFPGRDQWVLSMGEVALSTNFSIVKLFTEFIKFKL